MTPPPPTAPTAAELRDRFLKERAPLMKHVVTGKLRYIDGFEADLDALVAAVRAEALASERERCALELDELAQEADMAAYACLGGATADTEPGEVLDGEGLSIAAATACAYRDGAARIRALVHR